MAITKRQSEVMNAIRVFIEYNGFSPSYAEIGHALGLRSLATVHKHVMGLRKKKLLDSGDNRGRSIQLHDYSLDKFRK